LASTYPTSYPSSFRNRTLKSFPTAAVVIGGIELAEKIKKGQFKLGKLGGRTATMPEIWRAALAA
jgi:hypothetical protein